jgi:hypothetical protein
MKRILGILFLVAAAVAAVLAYLGGGAAGDSVNFARITQRSLVYALTVPVCILIGFLLLRTK